MAFERFDASDTDAQPGDVDLTGKEFHGVKRTATGIDLCVAGDPCDGIVSEGKAAGLNSSFKTEGQLKVLAGTGGLAVGDKVTPDANGAFVVAGVGDEVFGTCMFAAAATFLAVVDVDRAGILA